LSEIIIDVFGTNAYELKLLTEPTMGNKVCTDILKAMGWLAEYAQNFRQPEIIKKHRDEILQIVEKIR